MRDLIVVDTETTGLKDEHVAIEVSWMDMTTGESATFLPVTVPSDWIYADEEALRINRWRERSLALAPTDVNLTETVRLHTQLSGNTLAGSNPAFDAQKLGVMFHRAGLPAAPFHHRLCDLAAFAGGVLGLDPTELPGLAKVCGMLGIEPGDHSARGDVRATVACFRKLDELRARRVAA